MLLPPPRTPATDPTFTTRPLPLALSNGWQTRTVANAAQIDRQHEVEELVVQGAQIGVRDHSGTAWHC